MNTLRTITLLIAILPILSSSASEGYVVTSLADSGRGSLRDAVSSGNRKISFRVGGVINLKKMISITANDILINGSSAPSPGITVRKKTFSISGAANITIRHLRFRYADDDCFRIVGACRNILIENCSFTHGGDGAFDITLDYKNPADRPTGITVRNCLIAATEKAMLVGGCDHLTLERNLYTNNGQRSPQLQDVRNFNLINNHIRNFSIYGVAFVVVPRATWSAISSRSAR